MNITIGRYPCPTEEDRADFARVVEAAGQSKVYFPADTWESWIEDEARTWIVFIARSGEPLIWLKRYPEGGVIGPPITRAFIQALYDRFGEDAIQQVIEEVRFGDADPEGHPADPALVDRLEKSVAHPERLTRHPLAEG